MADKFNNRDWLAIGEWAKDELNRRQHNRRDLEAMWKEVDRQLSMCPKVQEVRSGEKADWFADLELPLQFNALEVTAADARRLKFPRGTEWYMVTSEVSEDYINRFRERRVDTPLFPDNQSVQVQLNQETADTLVKASLDYWHRQYDFRTQIDLFDAESIKYGTSVGRVRPIHSTDFGYDFRGNRNESRWGPAFIAASIKNTFLDDSPPQVMQEGISSSPVTMRRYMQRLEALKAAGNREGAPDRGWIRSQINKLEPVKHGDDKRNMVELIEMEGDIIVPRSRGSIFLPNVLLTVACGVGDPRVVRFRENATPFRSYVVGHYMRESVTSPYGVSPLMKGQPIQEAATDVFNNMLSVGRLNANPPVVYDRNDPSMAAHGGPLLYPGAQLGTDAPDAIQAVELGSLGELANIYLALLNQHADLTGNTPERRGQTLSHRTALGDEIGATQGLARVDDFVNAQEMGPITDILYMEYEIIKKWQKSPIALPVNAGGIEGFVRVASADLPDVVNFTVQGSSGVASQREKLQTFIQISQLAIQMSQAAAATGQAVPLNIQEMLTEMFNEAGFPNAGRFISGMQDIPAGAEAVAPLQGSAGAANSQFSFQTSPLETTPGV